MAEPVVAALSPPAAGRTPEALEFPGCHAVRMTREEMDATDEIDDGEVRLEYWHAETEIAMVCDPPVSYQHELPAVGLAQLAGLIAAARGAPIRAVGNTDLVVRNARGDRQAIMQADQILFLYPGQATPAGSAIEVGTDALPDVVLEVDNTTDVRRGKLRLYDSWGFPEVWVEVPDRPTPGRPRSLRPGLTIHVREDGRFRTVAVSRAFPGWTADEIHRALNEPELSEATAVALKRVGRALGAAAGTGPDDDPFLRSERRESHAAGWTGGHAAGHAEALRASVLRVLQARGITVSPAVTERLAALEVVSGRLIDAAVACHDEEDFLRRLSGSRSG
jgi:Uma2 family endonuclease